MLYKSKNGEISPVIVKTRDKSNSKEWIYPFLNKKESRRYTMKFLVYKKFTEISGNKINDTDFSVKDQKVIELDEDNYSKEELIPAAIARYCEITNVPKVDNCTVNIAVIDKDLANIKIDPYKCARD